MDDRKDEPSRTDHARQVAEEYPSGPREIRKLRKPSSERIQASRRMHRVAPSQRRHCGSSSLRRPSRLPGLEPALWSCVGVTRHRWKPTRRNADKEGKAPTNGRCNHCEFRDLVSFPEAMMSNFVALIVEDDPFQREALLTS